ncbi:uncharacterized protein [Polyergus mexicanus]|uniref:uncharacterized protein isoform X2 n=1 Tax=Polyergus mexicanus TaxID=615972 RepID=UPI0038B68A9E
MHINKISIEVERLRGRYLFRSAVRRVLEYIEWITEIPIIEEISDDVTINIKLAQQRHRAEKKLLTLEDRSILLVNPIERSSTDKAYIYDLIKKLRAFSKHSEDLRENLAEICTYQYLPAGRVIVRQGHKAENLYFIANGEVSLSRVAIDELSGDEKTIDTGIMQSGDMFGEVALFHTIPRTSTVVTKTSVDLLLIKRDDFDNILRSVLTKKWNVLRDALVHFNYFKAWDEETVRECCILSKLKDFKPNEVLLGDGTGMVNYVHFILSGECRLIEHMLVRERPSYHGIQYELYDPEIFSGPQRSREVSKKITKSNKLPDLNYNFNQRPANTHTDVDRLSIVTTTLLDVCSSNTHHALLAKLEIPKKWFGHYYIISGLILLFLFYFALNKYFYDENVPEIVLSLLDTLFGSSRKALVSMESVILAIFVFSIHIWKRICEMYYICVFSDQKINIFHYILTFLHYMTTLVCLIGECEGFVRDSHTDLSLHKLTIAQLVYAFIFLCLTYMQLESNFILARLRKNQYGDVVTKEHKIPIGGLFNYISNPLQLTEILMYLMLSGILCQASTFHYVTLFVIINQIECAILYDQWYRNTFKNYPKERKILIPYIW